MTMTYGWEPLAVLLDEGLLDVLGRHWEEIALHKDAVPLDPDWPRYLALERAGSYRVWAARADGVLAGYFGWFIGPSLKYKSTRYCSADVYYMDEPHRKGRAGIDLIIGAVKALPRPSKVIVGTKIHFQSAGGTTVGAILERFLKMEPIEIHYATFLP